MSAGYHDQSGRAIVGGRHAVSDVRRITPQHVRRPPRWLQRALLVSVLALVPVAAVPPRVGVAVRPLAMAVAELPPPASEPRPPAAVEPPPALPEPPPVIVEMPPPIPGPPLALAVALPAHPPRKPAPPVRTTLARAAPAPIVVASASPEPLTDAPLPATSADAPLSAAEAALVEEYRRCTADNLYHPGGRHDPRCDRVLALAGKPTAPVTTDGWTLLETGRGGRSVINASYVSTAARGSGFEPQRLGDLTADEHKVILAERGIAPEHVHRVVFASKVRLLQIADTPSRSDGVRAVAVPIDAPAPVLPAAALQQKAEWVAVARVHVAPNGTTTEIAITKPVADAAVNHAIADALRRWRFRPTYISNNGWYATPDDSTIEVSVKLSVS